MHFGALYDGPTYAWTRDLDAIRRTFAWETETLGLEYADFGFLHCVDEPEDAEAVVSGGLLDCLRALKAEGRVRHIGLSTHDPAIARRLLACGEIDLLMFGRTLALSSYLYAGVLTAVFSLVVNLAAHRKLKKLDMVESLKTVE